MKHFSASLEQNASVTNGDITVTDGNSIISMNSQLDGTDRAIELAGAQTQFVQGNGEIVNNVSFHAVSTLGGALGTGAAAANMVHFEGVDGTISTLDLGDLAGAVTNDNDNRIPVKTTVNTENVFVDGPLLTTGATTTAGVTAGGAFTVTGALTANGNTTLGAAGTDSVTVASVGGVGTGIVTSTAAGVLERITSIPESFLPNITVGDVFTYSTNTDGKGDAETEFYAETAKNDTAGLGVVSPNQPYHKGDIAIITYDVDGTPMMSVLIYVGDNQATLTAGNNIYPASAADQWHDISITAAGVVSIASANADHITISPTTGEPVVTLVTGSVTDGGTGIPTQNDVFDFVTAQQIQVSGEVTTASPVSLGAMTDLAVTLSADVVDLNEINAVQEATPTMDAGKVLTIDTAGTGLQWSTPTTGSVNKAIMPFSLTAGGSSSTVIVDLSSNAAFPQATLNEGVIVQVYENGTNRITQIIPDEIHVNTNARTIDVVFPDITIAGRVVVTG